MKQQTYGDDYNGSEVGACNNKSRRRKSSRWPQPPMTTQANKAAGLPPLNGNPSWCYMSLAANTALWAVQDAKA
jgi:hypothetical protein